MLVFVQTRFDLIQKKKKISLQKRKWAQIPEFTSRLKRTLQSNLET